MVSAAYKTYIYEKTVWSCKREMPSNLLSSRLEYCHEQYIKQLVRTRTHIKLWPSTYVDTVFPMLMSGGDR